MKKIIQYHLGDKVFAIIKEYPPWPAIIVQVTGTNNYDVQFYGTGEIRSVKCKNLFYYMAFKKTYPKYNEALKEIENAVKESGGTDGNTEGAADSGRSPNRDKSVASGTKSYTRRKSTHARQLRNRADSSKDSSDDDVESVESMRVTRSMTPKPIGSRIPNLDQSGKSSQVKTRSEGTKQETRRKSKTPTPSKRLARGKSKVCNVCERAFTQKGHEHQH